MTGRYKAYPKMASASEVIIENHPEHWILTRVKFNSIVKARVGWHGLKSDDFTEVGPYLVTGSDFKGKFIQWEHCYHCDEERYDQDENIQLKNGDLLLTKDGTIGKVALVSGLDGKATLNSGVFVVRPITDEYTTQFYYWLLLSRAFTDFVDYYKTGSTIAHLYQDTFVNFKFPLPPLVEQQKIANFLDHETAKIDTLINKQEELIKLLKEKRQAVISHAVTKGLNPDAPMKDSGVEWLGEVPEHWAIIPLKHLCRFSGGGTPTKDNLIYWTNGTIPWVSPKDMKSQRVTQTTDYITEKAVVESSTNYVDSGALLMVVRSGILQRTIPVAINDVVVTLNQDMKALKFNQKMAVDFALHFIVGNEKALLLEWSKEGATVESIEHEYLANGLLPVPPMPEQLSIVQYLSTEMEKFSQLETRAILGIELLKERKTALISAAVTGKIDVRDWQESTYQESA
ncbi:restriction endonuclease subunit S [Vibrio cincinnatiensis]|uniref:restriction endonuclease subunit S n=1 Tax=Vibrio cincinnatiensis TaxID=675 RepID=UPI001EDEAC02|nr:restriction endonuclease subunit S [Vibrio cincinnatiensis]MCG3760064.1 restriction endonuclease subunit S [Vibrio cincinnatiensis]